MPTPETSYAVKPSGAASDTTFDPATQLAELRDMLAAVVSDVKNMVEKRSVQAKDAAIAGAEESIDYARNTIRSAPLAAIIVAALIGAAIGIAVTPRAPKSRLARLREWAPEVSRAVDGISGADFGNMAKSVQRSAASSGSSMLAAFERLADSVSSIDPKSSLVPALEKAANWFSSLRGSMKGK